MTKWKDLSSWSCEWKVMFLSSILDCVIPRWSNERKVTGGWQCLEKISFYDWGKFNKYAFQLYMLPYRRKRLLWVLKFWNSEHLVVQRLASNKALLNFPMPEVFRVTLVFLEFSLPVDIKKSQVICSHCWVFFLQLYYCVGRWSHN